MGIKPKTHDELIDLLKLFSFSSNIINALDSVDRKLFVIDEKVDEAYYNIPLPIGYDQTISQPQTVASMLNYLDIKDGDKILDVGTGSGYNAAVMSKVAKGLEIYSIELNEELIPIAKANLKKAGITNVKVLKRDGYLGLKEHAPYDKIIVAAAADKLPQLLYNQLRMRGGILIPINLKNGDGQIMQKYVKKPNGPEIITYGFYNFVPLRKNYKGK